MYLVRIVNEDDIPVVYEFVRRLMLHHLNMEEFWRMSEEVLRQKFHEHAFEALLLVEVATGTPSGLLLFSEEYSMRVGKGLYLDVFYLVPEVRGKGVGTLLMKAMCEEALKRGNQFIKVIFQDGLGLEKMYGHMGYINETVTMGTHMYELYGREMIEEVVKSEQLSTINTLRTIYLLPDSDVIPVNQQIALTTDDITGNMCAYVQQILFCSWSGKVLVMKDFVGDISILTADVLRRHIAQWFRDHPDICSIWLDIPEEIEVLSKMLKENLDMLDVTEGEGWNVSCMYRDGMLNMAKTT